MDCNKCKLEMVNLFDSQTDQIAISNLKEHLLQCPDCAKEFRKIEEVLSILKPKHLPSTPFLLKQNIINQLQTI